jgi:hypothetical protein
VTRKRWTSAPPFRSASGASFSPVLILVRFYFLLVRVPRCYVFCFLFREIGGGGGGPVLAPSEVVLVSFFVHARFENRVMFPRSVGCFCCSFHGGDRSGVVVLW